MPTTKTRATLRLIESLMPRPKHPQEKWETRGSFRIFLPDTGVPDDMPCMCSRCRKERNETL
mgnify:CR=1 FL=1